MTCSPLFSEDDNDVVLLGVGGGSEFRGELFSFPVSVISLHKFTRVFQILQYRSYIYQETLEKYATDHKKIVN